MMNKEDLIELREIFRARMAERDFCIGQDEVEELFRELLGEPEPVKEYKYSGPPITAKELAEAWEKAVLKAKSAFDAPDILYDKLRKKN